MGDSTVSGPLSRTGTAAPGASSASSQGAVDFQTLARAEELLRRLFRHVPVPVLVRLWSGPAFNVAAPATDSAPASFVFVFRHPRALSSLIFGNDPLLLAEGYFRGNIDIEGDLFAALSIKDHLEALRLPLGGRLRALIDAARLNAAADRSAAVAEHAAGGAGGAGGAPAHDRSVSHVRAVKAHSRDENRESIQFHYDVSNEFYQQWLDRAMVYSCGYFEREDATLDEAQQAKLEHICRKLLLAPGERFLDIGCGWGALVMHAARHHGVIAHGITLSERQLTLARARIAAEGLGDRVTVELRDYRDLKDEAAFDKVASVGMFEHVGLKNLPLYFAAVRRVLKPAGLFLNHGITHAEAGWDRKHPHTQFINRYVFPDGELDSVSSIQRVMEQQQFEITDVEGLRPHYAKTLRAWVERLERRHARVLEYVSEATYRVWRLYMAGCALEFEGGNLGIYQILAAKRGVNAPLPLTRRHLYLEEASPGPGASLGH
jgi:cyclopropane-fatty-acyl-phospholipid synthase